MSWPFAELLGRQATSVADDQARFERAVDARHLNPTGALHGGGTIGVDAVVLQRTKRIGPNSWHPDGVRREEHVMRRLVSILFGALLLTALLSGPAWSQDCSRLPTTAQKARSCNPQQECVARIEQRLKGPALESARRDCQRLPASGTCYGPETYSPQAECLARQGKKK